MWADPHDFGCFSAGVLTAAQLDVSRSQKKVSNQIVGVGREVLLEKGNGLLITPHLIVGNSSGSRIEVLPGRIEAHRLIGGAKCLLALYRQKQRIRQSLIALSGIGIDGDRPLRVGHRLVKSPLHPIDIAQEPEGV